MRALITAFSCSPRGGGELARGYRLPLALAALGVDVDLVTPWESTGDLPQRLNVVTVPIPRTPLASIPHGFGDYLAWLIASERSIRRLDPAPDVTHHLTWGSLVGGSNLTRVPAPFVFGPVGGGQTIPPGFEALVGRRTSAWRSARMATRARINPRAVRAVRHAQTVTVTNDDTRKLVERLGARSTKIVWDTALAPEFVAESPVSFSGRNPARIIWVGTVVGRKALPLAIDAIAAARRLIEVELVVIGDGPDLERCRQWAVAKGVADSVSFEGRLPWVDLPAALRSADAFLFTSLRDSAGDQVMEAMGQGLPVVTLDHQGMRDLVPDAAAAKVPVTSPEATTRALAAAIVETVTDEEVHQRRAAAALAFAGSNLWSDRAEETVRIYDSIR